MLGVEKVFVDPMTAHPGILQRVLRFYDPKGMKHDKVKHYLLGANRNLFYNDDKWIQNGCIMEFVRYFQNKILLSETKFIEDIVTDNGKASHRNELQRFFKEQQKVDLMEIHLRETSYLDDQVM